jgi:hypothetical protein
MRDDDILSVSDDLDKQTDLPDPRSGRLRGIC